MGPADSHQAYKNAQLALSSAKKSVDNLVCQLEAAWQKLQNWDRIGFQRRLPDGSILESPVAEMLELSEIPTRAQLIKAIEAWQKAARTLAAME
jgi:hypothetical protein